MAREKLIGFYGKLAIASISDITTGTLVADKKYVVKVIGGSSALPAGVEVGRSFISDGTEDITSSGDEVILLTESDSCDISSWSLDFSKAEIDVTTLCNDQNEYLGGRTDVTGSIEGIYKIGTTDLDGGFANNFFDIVRQAGTGGAVSIDSLDDSQIVLVLYKQKDTTAGEVEQAYVTPVTITSFSDSVTGADAQAFTSAFRIAPNDDIDFHLLSVTHV